MRSRKRSWRWTPANWASWKPFGIGERHPNNYLEILRAAWENRDRLGYAGRILTRGVCDGCALGTNGLRDWTLSGIHLCNVRLRLLRLNTMAVLDPSRLEDATALAGRPTAALRALGRLPHPLIRRRGEAGFTRLGWDEAMGMIADRIRVAGPDRIGFYLTSRGMTNESYYAAQKSVRAMGCASIDNAARVCHSPSTVALKATIGVGASTCSYSDWIGTDLLVFIGSNVANNQPVAAKYLHYAKKAGARIAAVNTYREPGMERYWVPSVLESALFGTKICDRFFLVRPGGDAHFLAGVLKHLVAQDAVDAAFVTQHTSGYEDVASRLETLSWEALERGSGASREEMAGLATMAAGARTAVLVWSMGVTQHECGEQSVRAIVNLALARGFIGREGCGLMPIRGHSGVQGGAEMGAYATAFPGGHPVNPENARHLAGAWGFPVPEQPGLTAPEMIDAAADGRLDVLFSAGGSFTEVLPDPVYVTAALARVPLRVHMDLVLSPQMLIEPAETVLVLPAATRYETPGGVTETSTERRVIFSPEIDGPRVAEARPEWEVLTELAARVKPDLAARIGFDGTQAIRDEIARVVPAYDGVQHLTRQGDQFQWGGTRLCEEGRFATADSRARFSVPELADNDQAPDMFSLTTRRGKQFNSMVQAQWDPLTGAARDSVLMSPVDAARLGFGDGDRIELAADSSRYQGRVMLAEVIPGSLQVHWPEGNVLVNRSRRSTESGIPDYNAVVRVRRVSP